MTVRSFQNQHPRLGERVYVDPDATVIGDVELGDDVSIWPRAVVRGDVHSIRVARATNIQDGAVLHVTHDSPYHPGGAPLVLDEEITVGHSAVLHGCRVGRHCLIGTAAVVLDGAVLEPEVLLAAGSLVPPGKFLEGGYLWRGRPARRARALSGRELESLRYAAAHYLRLKDRYRE